MFKNFRLTPRFMSVAVALAAIAALAAACTKASDATAAPSDTLATAEATATSSQAIPVANTDVSPTSASGDAAPQQVAPAQEITPGDVIAAQEALLTELYDRVVPSVVKITTQSAAGIGEGSGFVWDTDGHIVTNFHVVQGANAVGVLFADGREYSAEIVASDPDADIAVIRIDARADSLIPAEPASSNAARVGQLAVAIGNPFGRDFTMTTGIVSAVGRDLSSGFSNYLIPAVIQTDAAINPGNSGGPLLDRYGRVLGINTQIESDSRQSSGVGFAVPIDLIKRVVPSLIDSGAYEYAFMGISGTDIDLAVRAQADLPEGLNGVLLGQVTTGGPAHTAGLRGGTRSIRLNGTNLAVGGDVVLAVDGEEVRSMNDLIAYLALNKSPGDSVEIRINRNGEEMTVSVELGTRPN